MATAQARFTFALLLGIAWVHRIDAQVGQPASPTLLQADSAYQRKDWKSATEQYTAIAHRDTANALAWFRLGTSHESQRNFREAANAYQRVVTLGVQTQLAELRLARVYAQLNEIPVALVHLRAAAKFGFVRAITDNDPGLAPLRSEADYATIVNEAEGARYPCRAVHTFDYWAGTWSLNSWAQPTAQSGGTAVNTRQYEGCVFIENFTAAGASTAGMSMVFFDATTKAWRMIWDDDRNGSNVFEGDYRDGAMRFLGWVVDAKGVTVRASNTLQNVSPDTIRQTYSTSPDSGRTWVVQSDARWVRQGKPAGT